MRLRSAVSTARLGPLVIAAVIAALFGVPAPAAAAEAPGMASASWHGRAIQDPKPRPEVPRAGWPAGWSAGAVGPGSGYVRPGGSDRVRDVQRRLTRLGYRPGPVDGLFGPRTRAAVRWFQYKHGLPTRGRVDRSTLHVLHARSDGEPLRAAERQPTTTANTPNPQAAPDPQTAPDPRTAPDLQPVTTATDDGDATMLVVTVAALLLAFTLGVVAGLRGPSLLRRKRPGARVLGYAAGNGGEAATRAIAARCADREWALVDVIRDDPTRRRGLDHAVGELRAGRANGLVLARLDDVDDLATLVHHVDEANAFLAAADHPLDTSTDAGRATARAIVKLGAWERRRRGRFPPSDSDLAEEIVALLESGIPPRALAEALLLAGFNDHITPSQENRRM